MGCWFLRCRELAVNDTDAVLQIDRGGDDLFFIMLWSLVGTVSLRQFLLGGHNLFFSLENYFRIVPVLPSCLGPSVSPMKYDIFYKHPY